MVMTPLQVEGYSQIRVAAPTWGKVFSHTIRKTAKENCTLLYRLLSRKYHDNKGVIFVTILFVCYLAFCLIENSNIYQNIHRHKSIFQANLNCLFEFLFNCIHLEQVISHLHLSYHSFYNYSIHLQDISPKWVKQNSDQVWTVNLRCQSELYL